MVPVKFVKNWLEHFPVQIANSFSSLTFFASKAIITVHRDSIRAYRQVPVPTFQGPVLGQGPEVSSFPKQPRKNGQQRVGGRAVEHLHALHAARQPARSIQTDRQRTAEDMP